jgi:uncharacterized spore protein YtfJ
MSFHQYFQSIIERLQSGANVKTVYGDPVTIEGRTIIPVAKVGCCFGEFLGQAKDGEQDAKGKERGGMGGAVRARPLGVVEITKEETRFIPIHENRKLAGALLVGLILGLLIASKRSRS